MRNKIRFVEQTILDAEDVFERKKNLRAYMKERRGQNENRDIKEKLLIENFFKAVFPETVSTDSKRTFFIYLSFSSEAPTDVLIEKLLERDCDVYCPRIENGQMQAVQYAEDFSLSDYGIREPIGKNFQGELDVIVLPLLAVDEKGNRLGYGKGYYDAYLRAHPSAKRIGYCYDFQICNNVPMEEHDEKIDVIVTDKRIIDTAREVADD